MGLLCTYMLGWGWERGMSRRREWEKTWIKGHFVYLPPCASDNHVRWVFHKYIVQNQIFSWFYFSISSPIPNSNVTRMQSPQEEAKVLRTGTGTLYAHKIVVGAWLGCPHRNNPPTPSHHPHDFINSSGQGHVWGGAGDGFMKLPWVPLPP